jgi:hypothetical protein
MNVLNKQLLLHKNLICSKKNNVYLTYFFDRKSQLAINNVLSSAGYVPFPTLMRIVSAHIIPYDVHEYLVFQKI